MTMHLPLRLKLALPLAWLVSLALWLPMLAAPAHAQSEWPVPLLSGRVIDQTATLTADQVQALSAKLEKIERERGAQLVVLIVPSTLPEDIAAYAQRVGEAWRLGRKGIGDGLLIVVAKNDRKVRIEVAKALEGAVPDLAAKQIINDRITPAFKAGDFAGGLNSAVDRLAERIGSEGLPEPAVKSSSVKPRAGFDFEDLGIFFLVGVPIVATVLTAMLGRKAGVGLTAGAAGVLGWFFTASFIAALCIAAVVLVAVGVFGFGTRRGGPIVWGGGDGGSSGFSGFGSSGGGGGFSSGGGGDFGGGGASGDW